MLNGFSSHPEGSSLAVSARHRVGAKVSYAAVAAGMMAIALAYGIAQTQMPVSPKSGTHAGRPARPAITADGSLAAIAPAIQQAIQDHKTPGAVVLIGHAGRIVYRRAFGSRALVPRRLPMRLETVFDLASLTKVIATTTA